MVEYPSPPLVDNDDVKRLVPFVVAVVVGVGFGILLAALIGLNAASVPKGVQVALIGLLGGVVGALGGAAIGAYAATVVAKGAREDARLAREDAAKTANLAAETSQKEATADRTQRAAEADAARELSERLGREAETLPRRLELYARVLTIAEGHETEVRNQAARRTEVAGLHADSVSIPTVNSADELNAITGTLYFLSEQSTADRAQVLNNYLTKMDRYVFDRAKHVDPQGAVVGLTDEEFDRLRDALGNAGQARLRFTQAVRAELGRAPLSGMYYEDVDTDVEDELQESGGG